MSILCIEFSVLLKKSFNPAEIIGNINYLLYKYQEKYKYYIILQVLNLV